MKIIHLSDLHIGKRVNEFSMIDDQEYILGVIVNIVDIERPAAVIIAGDVYDKTVPSAEAVQLFDSFLVQLHERDIKVFVISGNHDSAERIAFGGRLMSASGVFMSPVYTKDIEPVVLKDEFGKVNIYMLPFIKPSYVRAYFPDKEITSYTEAVRAAVNNMEIDTSCRNLLVTHQFVTGAERCESEDISIGGTDNVDVSVFDDFDYVALGHIHGPQKVGRETVRYCGTPLKYSFSECRHNKSVTVVELGKKGNVNIRTVPLIPKRNMREIRGTYDEVTARSFYEHTNTEDYIHITLTDEQEIPGVISKLRVIYPNIMKLDYDNTRTRTNVDITGAGNIENKTPHELFSEFFELRNNMPMTETAKEYIQKLIEEVWEVQS